MTASVSSGTGVAAPAAERSVLVEFADVTKRFGDAVAVDNVSLQIREGEFFALLGPSGCGKTTLMRMLAGFEQPTTGQVLFDGEDIAGVPPHRRPVNMMFQSYALFPHMTVASNIAFGLRQEHVPKVEIADRVAKAIELVQLHGLGDRKPHQLSGGQRQRAALARAIVKSPRILLLDEPLAALDKKLRQETQLELVNIQETLGITFLVVTHDQEEAMTVADRIAVMDHGRIAQVATPSEIYEAPNSRYVADFIGEANLLDGTVELIADGLAHVRWGADLLQCRCAGMEIAQGQAVCVALRPEKVRLDKSSERPSDPNLLRAQVEDIRYVGNLSTYHVKLSDGRRITAQVTNESRLVERTVTWEDEVWLHWTEHAGVLLTC